MVAWLSKKETNDADCLFSVSFLFLQALLWAPSPRFWFLCSSLALGGLATKGLRLPSLKSDVHSTCWFSKQLCPHKKIKWKIRTSRSPSATGGEKNMRRQGENVGGGVLSLSYQTISLSLSFSLTAYLSLSYPKCLIFIFFWFILPIRAQS